MNIFTFQLLRKQKCSAKKTQVQLVYNQKQEQLVKTNHVLVAVSLHSYKTCE